jgi:hypothetical protein
VESERSISLRQRTVFQGLPVSLNDLEYRAWSDLAGGIGTGTEKGPGRFDHAINYFCFVPNLLIAEFFIRNKHKWRR